MTSLREIDAVVLVGGQGTRLRSVVSDRPKPLVEVAGRPFLTYVLDALAIGGIRRVTLCTGYRAGMVEATFGRRYGPLRLSYSRETRPLGTAGAVVAALPRLRSSTILITNGDSLCHADFRAFLRFHRWQGCDASLLLTHVEDAARFGRVEIDEAERIVAFAEKDATATPGWINAGVYLVERRALAAFSTAPLSWERDVFPGLIQAADEKLASNLPPSPLRGEGRGERKPAAKTPLTRSLSKAERSFEAIAGRGACTGWAPAESRLCGWAGGGPFLDIGTPESLAEAEDFLRRTPFRSANPVSCDS